MSLTQPQLTKAQRREAAREAAQRAAEADAARDARNKRIIWGLLGALLVGLVVAVVVVVGRGPQREAAAPIFDPVPMDQLVNVPANTTPEGGFALTATGGTTAYLDPDLPTLDVYFDYLCVFCQQFEMINAPGIEAMVANGEANVVMHPVAILNRATPRSQFSTRSVAAAGWIAQYSPENFWNFHLLLFENQPSGTGGDLTNAQIASLATIVGVPESVAAGIEDGTAMNTFGQWAVSLTELAVNDPALLNAGGTFGTPTVLINGAQQPGLDWTDPSVLPAALAAAAG